MDDFTGVVTTGIYCRPGCAGTPLERNTRPYTSAAAAEAAGFRPCLRCRPDREPVAGWVEAPELVCRALRAIADGALDDATEDALAPRLGVSARHLRRLFDVHVGATPAEVARSRRAHFARRLLDDTDLPFAQVARAAGFNSVRQFNRVMKDVFRFTPQELRARAGAPTASSPTAASSCGCRTARRSPGHRCSRSSRPRAIPGVETIDLGHRGRASTDGSSSSAARRASSRCGTSPTGPRSACASTSPISTASCTCSRACAGSSISTPTRP